MRACNNRECLNCEIDKDVEFILSFEDIDNRSRKSGQIPGFKRSNKFAKKGTSGRDIIIITFKYVLVRSYKKGNYERNKCQKKFSKKRHPGFTQH